MRPGFTLIELLIVITIIGILASIAMPKLSRVRERGYYKAMMSDLRNLQVQQEIYFSIPMYSVYATDPVDIENFRNSPGVTVTVSDAGTTGWAATATHAGLDAAQLCAVFVGTVPTVPAPAFQPGTVSCTGD